MVANTSSSFSNRTSPTIDLYSDPAYLAKITQSPFLHHGPSGNFSFHNNVDLVLRTRPQVEATCCLSKVSCPKYKPPLVFQAF